MLLFVASTPIRFWLSVANSSAFVYEETFGRRQLRGRERRQTANTVPYTLSVTEPLHPELGAFVYSDAVAVLDLPLQATHSSSVISPVRGVDTVQFSLLYQVCLLNFTRKRVHARIGVWQSHIFFTRSHKFG